MSVRKWGESGTGEWLAPMMTIFCCCIPIGAFAPNLSTRKRIGIFAAWLAMFGVGWSMSGQGLAL